MERANQTLQDRLPKEMRLLGIHNREDGNACLTQFIEDFNLRFAEEPRSTADAHRLLTAKDNLAHILIWQEQRTISKNLTVQFENVVYQIQTERSTYTMRNAMVTVCADAQPKVTLLYKGKALSYNVFHICTGVRRKCKQTKQAEVVLTKDLNKKFKVKPVPAPDLPLALQK